MRTAVPAVTIGRVDVPSPVSRLLQPMVLRERWARPRIAVNLAVIGVALVLPGVSALVLVPENAGEGWGAVLLAVGLTVWQVRRLWSAGFEVGPAGIRPLRGGVASWSSIDDVHWHTQKWANRQAATQSMHWLRMTTEGTTVRLTRYPATDGQADRLTSQLRELGVPVPTPDWSAVRRPDGSGPEGP